MPRLDIICGLPGVGKTTCAKALEAATGALRMDPDQWLQDLALDIWDEERRTRIEALQWTIAQKVLAVCGDVIIEWGTWGRDERLKLIDGGRALGAQIHLHLLEAPLEVLVARIAARGREIPPVTRSDVEKWWGQFQYPDAEEFTLYDEVHCSA